MNFINIRNLIDNIEEFDKEKGLLCCIVKYICGNDNSYHRLFKDWTN